MFQGDMILVSQLISHQLVMDFFIVKEGAQGVEYIAIKREKTIQFSHGNARLLPYRRLVCYNLYGDVTEEQGKYKESFVVYDFLNDKVIVEEDGRKMCGNTEKQIICRDGIYHVLDVEVFAPEEL